MALRGLSAFALVALLAGCGNSPEAGTVADLAGLMAGTLTGGLPAAAPDPGEGGGTAPEGFRLTLENGGREALMTLAREQDGVALFATADPVSFAFAGGRLIETRGLPFDLMSADREPSPLHLRGGETYLRRWRVIGADDLPVSLSFHCRATVPAGPRMPGIPAEGQLTEEHCRGEGDTVLNYFLTSETLGLLWSRQWMGPRAGYAVLRRTAARPAAARQ